jgi:hypothetical protein
MALVGVGSPGAVTLLVEGQLVARIEAPSNAVWTAAIPRSSVRVFEPRLESWKSVRMIATAPKLEEREACAARRVK